MLFKILYRIALLEATVIVVCLRSYPRIQIPLGTVRGQYKTSAAGRIYESYENIPYALPPIGDKRFEPPQPMVLWSTERNGTAQSKPCMQYHFSANVIFGHEDCLYLNIYKPSQKFQFLLPIIIGIHGGGFQFGQGAELGPKYIVDKDVIFVTFNYRLGPLGFLSTGDAVVPGNMGLKDQSLALRWIHEYSKFFGGDANRITIVGVSSGAASVQYHYLSPMSRGLFQNGISLSGTALAPWAFTRNPIKVLKTLLAELNCPDGNSIQIVKCMKNLPAYTLYNATRTILSAFKFSYFLYLPVAENIPNNFFIDRDPQEILRSGHVYDVPWITGVVSEEGLYSFAGLIVNDELTGYVNNLWNEIIPYMLHINKFTSNNMSTETAMSIRKYYFENSFNGDLKDIKTLAHLIGDSSFLLVGERAARLQASVNKSPVWFYYYKYRGAHSLSEILANTTENLGVCHGDDAFSVFQIDVLDPRSTAQDKEMSIKLLNFWYSIASLDRQNIMKQNEYIIGKLIANGFSSSEKFDEWPKVNARAEEFSYLEINGPNELLVQHDKNFGNKLFWTSIGL